MKVQSYAANKKTCIPKETWGSASPPKFGCTAAFYSSLFNVEHSHELSGLAVDAGLGNEAIELVRNGRIVRQFRAKHGINNFASGSFFVEIGYFDFLVLTSSSLKLEPRSLVRVLSPPRHVSMLKCPHIADAEIFTLLE